MSVWDVMNGSRGRNPLLAAIAKNAGKSVGSIAPPAVNPALEAGDLGMPGKAAKPMMSAPMATVVPTAEDIGPAPKLQGNGVFDRIGAFLGSDDGRAALFRSGAETLRTGNIGAGLAAGAGWMDEQRLQRARQAQIDKENELRTRGVDIDQQRADQSGIYQAAQIDDMSARRSLDVAKLEEAIRKAQAGERLDTMEMLLLNKYREGELALGYQKDATARRGQDVTMRGQDIGWREHLTPSGSTVLTQDRTDDRYYNPPAPALTTTTTTKKPGAVEGEEITVSTKASLPRITTQAAYDALPRGTEYMDSLGRRAVKK